MHECMQYFSFLIFLIFCLILAFKKKCMSALRMNEHIHRILWWFMRMYDGNAYVLFLIKWECMHKTSFFIIDFWLIFFENTGIKLYFFIFLKIKMHRWMHKNSILLFYISIRMYFQNSSYVIEGSMDAFEDVWCICECMLYVKICDACLDV